MIIIDFLNNALDLLLEIAEVGTPFLAGLYTLLSWLATAAAWFSGLFGGIFGTIGGWFGF